MSLRIGLRSNMPRLPAVKTFPGTLFTSGLPLALLLSFLLLGLLALTFSGFAVRSPSALRFFDGLGVRLGLFVTSLESEEEHGCFTGVLPVCVTLSSKACDSTMLGWRSTTQSFCRQRATISRNSSLLDNVFSLPRMTSFDRARVRATLTRLRSFKRSPTVPFSLLRTLDTMTTSLSRP